MVRYIPLFAVMVAAWALLIWNIAPAAIYYTAAALAAIH
jgi:hypothetical protein